MRANIDSFLLLQPLNQVISNTCVFNVEEFDAKSNTIYKQMSQAISSMSHIISLLEKYISSHGGSKKYSKDVLELRKFLFRYVTENEKVDQPLSINEIEKMNNEIDELTKEAAVIDGFSFNVRDFLDSYKAQQARWIDIQSEDIQSVLPFEQNRLIAFES
jgi:hypothetical protein